MRDTPHLKGVMISAGQQVLALREGLLVPHPTCNDSDSPLFLILVNWSGDLQSSMSFRRPKVEVEPDLRNPFLTTTHGIEISCLSQILK
jgi:hypothetical protein